MKRATPIKRATPNKLKLGTVNKGFRDEPISVGFPAVQLGHCGGNFGYQYDLEGPAEDTGIVVGKPMSYSGVLLMDYNATVGSNREGKDGRVEFEISLH